MSTGETTILRRPAFVPGGRTVSAGRGWAWIAEGWKLFARAWFVWICYVAALVAMVAAAFVLLPDMAVQAVFTVLTPVFLAGLVIGCADLGLGGKLEFGALFRGFRTRLGTLAAIGLLYLVALAVAVAVTLAATGVNVTEPPRPDVPPMTQLLAQLILLALTMPSIMGIWFAPPLVVFHDLGVAAAIRQSFLGCLRNVLPFLLYGVSSLRRPSSFRCRWSFSPCRPWRGAEADFSS